MVSVAALKTPSVKEGIIIQNFLSPGVRLLVVVDKLGCHLQVAAAFVI